MTQAELAAHIFDAYSVEPDRPFPRDEVSCVFRHADNRKWFALTMTVPCRTLGIPREGSVEILNVKCDPLVIGAFRGKPGFLPAYHMNKDKWLTILLDGSAPAQDIRELLRLSYDLTARRARAPKKRAE